MRLAGRILPVLLGAVVIGASGAAADVPTALVAARPVSGVQWAAPVAGRLRVLTPFDPPATPYGPGHRGVDLAAGQGTPVYSAGAGTVSFAGQVAGRGVVVIAHPDGIRTEYEPLHPVVHAGEQIVLGAMIGRVDGRHPSCAPASCLHWGARRGTTYLDPLDLLSPLGPVRLLPLTGG